MANRLNGHTEAKPDTLPAPISATADDLAHDMRRCHTDVSYALRQLRQFRDIGRAVDALERVECLLSGV